MPQEPHFSSDVGNPDLAWALLWVHLNSVLSLALPPGWTLEPQHSLSSSPASSLVSVCSLAGLPGWTLGLGCCLPCLGLFINPATSTQLYPLCLNCVGLHLGWHQGHLWLLPLNWTALLLLLLAGCFWQQLRPYTDTSRRVKTVQAETMPPTCVFSASTWGGLEETMSHSEYLHLFVQSPFCSQANILGGKCPSVHHTAKNCLFFAWNWLQLAFCGSSEFCTVEDRE